MYKPFDLSGKVALVTGGNGGIGLGMADALAQAGADVVVWGTNEAKNTAAAKSLAAHGKGGARITEMTTELFRRVHAVNEDGVFWTFREAARHMVDRAKSGDATGSLVV